MTHKGFTLVEILIVVVILGILAAIVVPQFTEASKEARESALASDLQTVRSQLELYRIQHKGDYPANTSNLMIVTDIDGAAGADYGPYLTKFPSNPFTDTATVDVDGTKGGSSHGWYYKSSTGEFTPDDDAHMAW
ncbi:hypothetical protein LCGC14_0321120 [marine sediment metagenome]|uniref:Type II secretion system protein GspG C-terminal domain-containing protein n=1 Tax=marine sediment metagenome TaxID=412755 RepID=A0A0F9TJ94_9ZZZZ